MNDAPSHLLLSALTWNGEPTVWTLGEEDEHIGTYVEAATARLIKGGINTELEAVEYTPVNPIAFQYTRHAYVGSSSSEVTYYGGVFGENMPPLVRICLPGRRPWPERFHPSYYDEYIKRPRTGPPFEFYNPDWTGVTRLDPSSLHGLTFKPDLPGQSDDGLEPDMDAGHEQDSTRSGTNVSQLGERNEIVWHPSWRIIDWVGWRPPGVQEVAPPITWGVEVRLQGSNGHGHGPPVALPFFWHVTYYGVSSLRLRQPIKITELDAEIYEDVEEPDPSRGISSYTVRATILRVLVKNEWFVQANNSDGQNEDEDEGAGSEGDGEDAHEGMGYAD
ncbi:hypothetical protein C8R45DRAFT_1083685 [Mycena sanguinolenta]|nr:hypothetical protein C8R45DRAFT_1083685 [Mycena sanguinolenta]